MMEKHLYCCPEIARNLSFEAIGGGEGGGSGLNFKFSCFQYDVVVLDISFPKWAYLSLNIARLLRYDATKFATTGAFSPIC